MRIEKIHNTVTELRPELLSAYISAFINRTDCYPLQLDKGSYVSIKKPLITDMVTAHLKGIVTIGAYALDENSNAKWLCFDADRDEPFADLVNLAQKIQQEGVTGYLEQSRRGGHLWFFTASLSGADVRRFGQQLLKRYDINEDIEVYPKQNRLVTGTGSLVRLPFGVHRKTGRRYHFITPEGEPLAPTIRQQLAILAHPKRVPEPYINDLLATAPEISHHSPTPPFQDLPTGSGDTLSEVLKSTISVHQFVGQYVQLDEQNKGFCPFHDDQHASFQVNAAQNYWHCYAGCGGGSIIDFWSNWRQVRSQDGSFTETVKELRKMIL